jgi:nucleotide-binding universal stress UspA family protein
MKIMVCYDGSKVARRALEDTVEYFKAIKPEIILLTVAREPLDASMEGEAIFEKEKEEYQNKLKKTANWVVDNGLDVDVMMAYGEPRRMIMEAIDNKNPDVVVIARQKKSGLESAFRESMSAHLIKNAGCHLLIMGPARR